MEKISRNTLDGLIATVVRNNRGAVPHEVSAAVMEIVWKELNRAYFECDELEKELATFRAESMVS